MVEPGVEQVQIFNSEFNKNFDLYVRRDRIEAFYRFLLTERHPDRRGNSMPGISWGAVLGLDAIFARRPKKFPVHDIILWLKEGCVVTPEVTGDEIEYALERFSAMYPPDASEDA